MAWRYSSVLTFMPAIMISFDTYFMNQRILHKSLEESLFELDLRFNKFTESEDIAILRKTAATARIDILLSGNRGLNTVPFFFPTVDVPTTHHQNDGSDRPFPSATSNADPLLKNTNLLPPVDNSVSHLKKTIENAKLLRDHAAAQTGPNDREKRDNARRHDRRYLLAKQFHKEEKRRLREKHRVALEVDKRRRRQLEERQTASSSGESQSKGRSGDSDGDTDDDSSSSDDDDDDDDDASDDDSDIESDDSR